MNVLFENVKLGFTNCMTRESDYGSYNFSFIIDKDSILEKTPQGSLDVYDSKMNPVKNYNLPVKQFDKAVKQLNRFFK